MNGVMSRIRPAGIGSLTMPPTIEQAGQLGPATAFASGGVPGVVTAGTTVSVGRTALTILVIAVIGIAAFDVWTREFQK